MIEYNDLPRARLLTDQRFYFALIGRRPFGLVIKIDTGLVVDKLEALTVKTELSGQRPGNGDRNGSGFMISLGFLKI
jgi:hypothetical protein